MVGLSLDDAKSKLQGDDYKFNVVTKYRETNESPNTVLDQNPVNGKEVEKGTTVTLTVAKAVEKTTVPDVSNQTCDAAKQQMQANGLTGNCTEVDTNDPNQVGKVIQTAPAIGTQVEKLAGQHPDRQAGPAAEDAGARVIGQTVAQARQTLQAAGFTNIQFAGGSSQDDNAFVINQDPKPDQQVDNPGATTITLQTIGGGGNGGNGNGNGNGGIFG